MYKILPDMHYRYAHSLVVTYRKGLQFEDLRRPEKKPKIVVIEYVSCSELFLFTF